MASRSLILLSMQELERRNTTNTSDILARARARQAHIHTHTHTQMHIDAHARAGCVHGNVLFNLVGYYECLGYPFRGWTMILLQFRLY